MISDNKVYLWGVKTDNMELYHSLSLESFMNGWQEGEADPFRLNLYNLLQGVPEKEYNYGLSLLRESIVRHEQERQIPLAESKREIPFFREKRKMLIGPEVELYIAPFYEDARIAAAKCPADVPYVTLTFDYEALASHCIFENLFLLRCKYDKEEVLKSFAKQMEKEYDTFFYDAEHSGFTPDSHFFSLLCNAVLEVKEPSCSSEKEWRLAALKTPSEAKYLYKVGRIISYWVVPLPIECIKKVTLHRYEQEPLLYSALVGFMESKGLNPVAYLTGMQES